MACTTQSAAYPALPLPCASCLAAAPSMRAINPQPSPQAYIDFEIGEGNREGARELYERLLQRTRHVKVGVETFSCGFMIPWIPGCSAHATSRWGLVLSRVSRWWVAAGCLLQRTCHIEVGGDVLLRLEVVSAGLLAAVHTAHQRTPLAVCQRHSRTPCALPF